jgi:hypothetical protein
LQAAAQVEASTVQLRREAGFIPKPRLFYQPENLRPGGLISSTLLTQFLLPTLYDWFDRSSKPKDAAHNRELAAA